MKFTLGKKLMGGFLLIVVFMLGVAVTGIYFMDSLDKDYSEIVTRKAPVETLVWRMRSNQLEMVADLRGYMLYKDEQNISAFDEIYKTQKQREGEADQLTDDEQARQYLNKLGNLTDQYNEAARQIFSLVKAGDEQGVLAAAQKASPMIDEYKSVARELSDFIEGENAGYETDAAASARDSKVIAIILTVLAAVIGVALGLIITRGITQPVLQMVALLRDMAEAGGDLTKRISVAAKDEIGDLAQWFNAFMDKLHDIIYQVRASANMVSASANETSIGNQDLSQRTEEQASSLEEISSTIEEVTGSLQKSSQSATAADTNSKNTLRIVHKGETVVQDLQQAMAEITKGSHEIADIIAKVNDIAFQTNLLALNAAVEAARAGEQGRGFAVVAAEVRNLAGRTAESAKEIEGLIKDSISKVERGNDLMNTTAEVLNEIVDNTQRTTDVIFEIASSMREQSAASEDIRTAVEQLNQVTQQNASLVEEIAGASESVSNEAEELSSLVGQFRLRDLH